MPILPRPYPDEIVGSILLRGRRHLGLALKPFLTWVFQSRHGRSSCSFVLGPSLARVSSLCGLEPRELLVHHTVFPYIVAFLPAAQVERLERKLLLPQPRNPRSTAALAQNVLSSSPYRRYCPTCAREDQERYGETYWHRAHQLPAITLCTEHRTPLVQTSIRLAVTSSKAELSLPPPSGTAHQPAEASTAKALALLDSTARVLQKPLETVVNWCAQYQHMARVAGFVHPSGDLATGRLAEALFHYYGSEALAELQCEMNLASTQTWPALLLRPGNKQPTSVVRHVLLDAFLRNHQDDKPQHVVPRKRKYPTRDYVALDQLAATRLRSLLADVTAQGRRVTMSHLLHEIGIRSAYLHGSERFPRCHELLESFKRSDLSERQLGGREYWRRRLPSRWGLASSKRRRT